MPKINSLSCCPFVPEQKNRCPAIPLSRNKSSRKNPGTKLQNKCQKSQKFSKKKHIFFKNCNSFTLFFSFCPVSCPWTEQDRLSKYCPKMSQCHPVSARPMAKFHNLIPAHPLVRFWACPNVPLSLDFCSFVTRDKTVPSHYTLAKTEIIYP